MTGNPWGRRAALHFRLFCALGMFLSVFAAVPTAFAQINTEVRIQGDHFLSPSFDATSQTTYQYVGAHFRSEESSKEPFQVDFQGAYAVGAPLLSYMNIREMYYLGNIGDRQSFALGRKRERWSDLDRRWNLGLVEPVFKWNPLMPESQGLSGLFWEVKDGDRRLGLFGSFLYIPDQGPSFDINSKGEFTRGNPWFQRPPESIRVLSEVAQIEYRLNKPPETEVIFQPTFGGRFSFGEGTFWRARVSHLYKPMNQLALGYQGYLDLAKDKGVVDLQPGVVFHNVTSVDLNFGPRQYVVGVSTVLDRPTRDPIFDDGQWTEPRYQDAVLVTPYVDILLSRRWKLTLQSLHISGGEVTEVGPEASPTRASISGRFPHRDAAQAGLETVHRVSGSRVHLRSSVTSGLDASFLLWKGETRWETPTGWVFSGEFQLVQASEEEPAQRVEIRDYANNDRLLFGVSYVF